MKQFFNDSPIIACSSGHKENCAISILRISGFDDIKDYAACFSINLSNIKPRFAHFTNLIDSKNNDILDEVILLFFPKGASFTGENILEIHCHGNTLNVDKIMKLFVDNFNVKYAQPGEFSYRAYKNKKLSMSQVEGLDLFLNAKSSYGLKAGMSGLSGAIDNDFLKLRDSFIELKSAVELNIDFLDDIGEEQGQELLDKRTEAFGKLLSSLNDRCSTDIDSLLRPDISFIGETNVGKSSLFNLLLNQDRSIVSDIHGTTRDYVSENILMKSQNFRLIDTAGLRETADKIEAEGIKRSLSFSNNSFLKVLVTDPEGLSSVDEKYDLILISKLDLLSKDSIKNIFKELIKLSTPSFIFSSLNDSYIGPIEPVVGSGLTGAVSDGPIEPVVGSGPMGAASDGPIEPLEGFSLAFKYYIFSEYSKLTNNDPFVIERHVNKIKDLYESWSQFQSVMRNEKDIAIISSQLNLFNNTIDELIGMIAPDHVLHNIFDNFCIGK